MTNTNNEITETQKPTYTHRDILKTLLRLDDETRDYITRMEVSQIESMVNNEANLKAVYQMCTQYIEKYTKLGNAIEKFMQLLEAQKKKGLTNFVVELVDEYESLPEEEKVGFLNMFVAEEIFNRNVNEQIRDQMKEDFSRMNGGEAV